MNEQREELMSAYAQTIEGTSNDGRLPVTEDVINRAREMADARARIKQNQDDNIMSRPEPVTAMRTTTRDEYLREEASKIGYHPIDVATLPTAGMFYPDDLKLGIRAARGGEIKHWSTMNDEDIMSVKEMWDYMIENCVSVHSKSNPRFTWKDMAEIDELYLLLAIRELTFIDDDNNLIVPISSTKEVAVTKEMVKYLSFPDELMRYYSRDEKCFVLKLKTGTVIAIYIPTFGVNEWIYNYVTRAYQNKEEIDRDFMTYAPVLFRSSKEMTEQMFKDRMYEINRSFGPKEWAVLSYVMGILKEIAVPRISYTTEDGSEASVPLENFLGGSKAIFSISDPLSVLC